MTVITTAALHQCIVFEE